MDATMFHQIFDSFSDPVFFHSEGEWQLNPAAEELDCLSSELDVLHAITEETTQWFHNGFCHITPTPVGDTYYYVVRPDSGLSGPALVVADQIRSPLGSALFAIRHLAGEGELSEACANDLATINQSLYRIFSIVNQLAMATLPDELFLNPAEMDLNPFLTSFVEDVRKLMEGMDVSIRLELPSKSVTILADQSKLRYLLLSLLSNSVKFRPDGQPADILISLKLVGRTQVTLTVSDNCTGLSPDALTYPLWERPLDFTFNRGVGLGLPIAQRIVAAHGGALMIVPQNEGSQVAISLPVRPDTLLFRSPSAGRFFGLHEGFSDELLLLADVLPNTPYRPN